MIGTIMKIRNIVDIRRAMALSLDRKAFNTIIAEGDAEAILAAGVDRYMTKPLRKQELTSTLADFCPAEALPIVLATNTAA